MNSSPITAMAKPQVDKSLLQSLLPQSKPQKEFADIFISTQSRSSQERVDRAPKLDHHREPTRAKQTAAEDRGVEDKRRDYSDNDFDKNKPPSSAVEPAEPIQAAQGIDDNSDTVEQGPSADSSEDKVALSAESDHTGNTESDTTEAESAPEDGVLVQGEVIAQGSVDVVTAAPVEPPQQVEGASPILTGSAAASSINNPVVDSAVDAITGAVVGISAKAIHSEGAVPSAAATSSYAVAKTVLPAASLQTQQSADPSSQVIEVEQLLADKPAAGAAIALKSTLELGGKPEGVMNSDVLAGRLAANIMLTGESRLTTKDALKDIFTTVKAGDAGSKQVAPTQAVPAGLESRPLSPQSMQFQTAQARLPAGLQAAVGQPGWGQAVGERVLMMAAKNLQAAEIQLDPPELGQLQVRVVMNHDQASVSFISPQQSVRDALDESAQRLRDMFESEGVELTDVDVSDQSDSSLAQQQSSDADASGERDDEPEEVVVQSVDMSLVDHYV